MIPGPSEDDARQSLGEHAAQKGRELREKYGPRIGWEQLRLILDDRSVVRYPCEIEFSAEGLGPGEFAHPEPRGESPEDGFTMRVHPAYADQPDLVPYLVLYQLVVVNYGGFASAGDAEAFGAAALGMGRDDYYETLCRLADRLGGGCA